MKQLISIAEEFLSFYLKGTNATVCLGIMLKNNDTLLEQISCI
jgi:hypothetical protein